MENMIDDFETLNSLVEIQKIMLRQMIYLFKRIALPMNNVVASVLWLRLLKY